MTAPKPAPQMWEGMSERQFYSLLVYVQELAAALDLKDWALSLEFTPLDPKEGAWAEVHATDGQREASIQITREWMTIAPERQRKVIVHELVHLHFEPGVQRLRKSLINPLGTDMLTAIYSSLRHDNEYGVDAIARFIAPHLPLPPS